MPPKTAHSTRNPKKGNCSTEATLFIYAWKTFRIFDLPIGNSVLAVKSVRKSIKFTENEVGLAHSIMPALVDEPRRRRRRRRDEPGFERNRGSMENGF